MTSGPVDNVHTVMLGALVTIPALLQDELQDLLHHVGALMYNIIMP